MQVDNLALVLQEAVQYFWVAPDEVNIRRKLRLPLVQERQSLVLGVPKRSEENRFSR